VVKANAYGHGAALIASEIAATIGPRVKARGTHPHGGGEWFGVDSLDEAVELREEGIGAPIIVLGWVPYPRLGELAKHDLRYLVSSAQTVNMLARTKKKVRVHLKIDTGTTRQGVLPADALKLAERIKKAGLVLEGVATHFANIEDVANPTYADLQLERFAETVRSLRQNGFAIPVVHTACTAAVMTRPETAFYAVRVGIGLYGLYPSKLVKGLYARKHRDKALLPVLSWRSRVALLKKVKANTPVGYGLTEKVKKDSLVAVVPVGYADGYDRSLSSVGTVLVRGRKARVIGRVCMNMFMADVTGITGVSENSIVTLIGSDSGMIVTADDLAERSDTVNYETVARISRHLPRILI
jgi:alanine racemase